MPDHIIKEIVVLLGFSILIITVSHKLKLPAVIGFLLTGIVIGPSGLKLINDMEMVDVMAEIGVAMLLFTIGLDFSPERIKQIKKFFLWGGGLQVVVTIGVIGGGFYFLNVPVDRSVFFGFLITLSSTAVVLKIYTERSELNSPQGNIAIGILLFQDIVFVPMIVLTRVFGETGGVSLSAFIPRFLLKMLIVTAAVFVLRFLAVRFFSLVVRTRIKELFVIAALFTCLGMAWLTMAAGFSMALGAFIAGMVISGSEYSHQIVSDVLSMKDLFNSIFFISIGMLIHLELVVERPGLLLILTPLIILVKLIIVILVVRVLRYPFRTALIAGFSLAQVGEFSFVLSRIGRESGLIDDETFRIFIAAAVLTIMTAPFMIRWSGATADLLRRLFRTGGKPVPVHGVPGKNEGKGGGEGIMKNHVIIAGFGINGRNLSRVLKETGIPYIVIELNPDTTRQCIRDNIPVIFGDISGREILVAAGIEYCRVLVLAISDPAATRRALKTARTVNPDMYIIVRARYIVEIDELYALGANQVIPEEFETSIEIFIRTLQEFHIPRNVIEVQTEIIRSERYGMLRGIPLQYKKMDRLMALLTAGTVETFMIVENSAADGTNLKELSLREKTGATVIAVVRGEKSYTSPSPDFYIAAGDILVLVAAHKNMTQAFTFLSRPGELTIPDAKNSGN